MTKELGLGWSDLYQKEDVNGDDIVSTMKSDAEKGFGIVCDTVTGLIRKALQKSMISNKQLTEIKELAKIGADKCMKRGENRFSRSTAVAFGQEAPIGTSSNPESHMPIFEFDAREYRKIGIEVGSILSSNK